MPYAEQYVVVPTNATTLADSLSSVVGAAPQWGDDDSASYARVVAKVGALFANEYGAARTELDPIPDLSTTRTQRIAVWYKADGTDPVPSRIGLSTAAGSQYLFRTFGWTDPDQSPPHQATDLPVPAGWSVAELEPAEGATPESLLSHWLGDPVWLDWTNGVPGTYEPEATTEWYWDVREMRVVVYVEVPSVAPPCRLFPREDGLGVGGGRHFPPPKSQQRSSRRFGYY